MRGWIWIVAIFVVGYVVGAKFPQYAARAGLA